MTLSFCAHARAVAAVALLGLSAFWAPQALAQQPAISIGAASVPEGNSGTRQMTMTVYLSAPSASPVTFSFRTEDLYAVAGEDYVARNLTNLTIPAGETSLDIGVTVIGDTYVEGNEVFLASLYDVSGATAFAGTTTGRIANDDPSSGPTIGAYDVQVTETDDRGVQASFTVTLSSAQPVDVYFDAATSDGTAKAGSDYAARTLTNQRIPAGSTSTVITVPIKGDTIGEAKEFFYLNLSNSVGASIRDRLAYADIGDNDPNPLPWVYLDTSYPSDEGTSAPHSVLVYVNLEFASTVPISVDIATENGSAVAGSDFVASSATVTFAPGETSKTFEIPIVTDDVPETQESFFARISNLVGPASYAHTDTAQIFVIDDDTAGMPFLSIADAYVAEGDSGSKELVFNIATDEFNVADISFDIATSGGTATPGADYVAKSLVGEVIPASGGYRTFTVPIQGDTNVEADEIFFVRLTNVVGARVMDDEAVGVIVNDDNGGPPLPTLSIGDVTVAEPASGTQVATFTVRLSAASASAVTYDIATANGSAAAMSDYQASSLGGQSIPAGATSKTFSVIVNADNVAELDETFKVNITNPNGATLADGQAIGTIINYDPSVAPTLSIADVAISEGNSRSKNASFTVSLSAASASAVSFDIATANGTALAGSDYVAKSTAAMQIAAGSTSRTFTVAINGDTTVEPNETFFVNLANPVGATLADGQAMGTITNDDGSGGTPTMTIADVSMAEGNSLSRQMTFTVKLSAPAAGPVTYNIATTNGTATSPSDYAAKSLSGQSIAPGLTSKTFTVSVKGDTVAEANETFKVNITGVSGATLGDGQAIGTISNDDAARTTIARFDAGDLVDDIDDGHREPQLSSKEYATLLFDTATKLCRRASGATVVAVEGVEHRQVLADLADVVNAQCAEMPAYAAAMADGDHRGFLISQPGKGEAGIAVSAPPQFEAKAGATAVSLLIPGHEQAVTLILASGTGEALPSHLRQRAKSHPGEVVILLGASDVPGMVDLTARSLGETAALLPSERVLANAALLDRYHLSSVKLMSTPPNEEPAQLLDLQ
jgi:chitinase